MVYGDSELTVVTKAFNAYQDRASRSREEDDLAAEFLKQLLNKK